MIIQSRYPIEPWQIREVGLDLELLAQSESVFALSNGHIGLRGNLDEGDPTALPGTYLNSFYERRPLPHAEPGYGYPEEGQTLLNVTNGKIIRLLVDDEPFDLRYGKILAHQRILDLRAGVLRRSVEWESPAGRVVRVRSTRLVSFTQRAIAAVHYQVETVNGDARIVMQSELVANEEVPRTKSDPRVAEIFEHPLHAEERYFGGKRAYLIHSTERSGLRMAAAMDHRLEGPPASRSYMSGEPDWARLTVTCRLNRGETAAMTKFLAYGWSSQRSIPALRDQVDAAISAAEMTGWDGLVAEQAQYLADFWSGADIEVDGDEAVQQAARFSLFHVLQSGARAETRAIPAKGLTGPGYDGHAFWDCESFVLPVLTATDPRGAGDALRWRHSTLYLAKERAQTLGLAGAAFPWRTIRGEECSGYWPAGTGGFHVNADIALAAARYVHWTGDVDFDREIALDLLVETARLWSSLGHHDTAGAFHIDGVTGPDEYSAIGDDNVFTNLAAARNMRFAADAVGRWPDRAANLGVTEEEVAAWRRADASISIPYDEILGIHQQDRGYTNHDVWDFQRSYEDEEYPLLLNAPYFELYRKQVVKQADLVLAMHWFGDMFTFEQKARAFAYYEALTVRDSSLSACTQAILAAEVGHYALAHDYLTEAAMIDLRDIQRNTRDGVHVASLAGAWLALVAGFGGMRDHDGVLRFAPALPDTMHGLRFALRWRDFTVRVSVERDQATYRLDDGPDGELLLHHHGKEFTVTVDKPVTLPIERVTPITPQPTQPIGREPPTARDHLTEEDAQGGVPAR
ncbi:MAG: glycoside hydrolase family 65 protein [Mycobacteriales bacterium]